MSIDDRGRIVDLQEGSHSRERQSVNAWTVRRPGARNPVARAYDRDGKSGIGHETRGELVKRHPGDDPRGARFPMGRGDIIWFGHVRHRSPGTHPHLRDCPPRLWTEEPAPAR